MKLNELSPNPKNPRTISEQQLASLKKSLYEFGDLSGFVFNRRTKQLVGGHQRGKAMDPNATVTIDKQFNPPTRTGTVASGIVVSDGEIFIYREVDWDETREKAANLAANKHGGDFDMIQVNEWLTELSLKKFDLDLTGFGDFNLPTVEITDMPDVTLDKKSEFQQLAFFLTDGQAETVKNAVSVAIQKYSESFDDEANTNKNSNAIEMICAEFLTRNG